MGCPKRASEHGVPEHEQHEQNGVPEHEQHEHGGPEHGVPQEGLNMGGLSMGCQHMLNKQSLAHPILRQGR